MSATATVQMHITPDKKPTSMKKASGLNREGQIVGRTTDVLIAPPRQNIPLEYRAYVKKVNDPNTKKYEGHVEFLKDNEKGGENMIIRYLSSCPFLDKNMQVSKGYEPDGLEEEIGKMYQGNTIIDIANTDKNKLYISVLENHPNNIGNPNRPKGAAGLFKIVNGELDIQNKRVDIEQRKAVVDMETDVLQNEETTNVLCVMLGISGDYKLDTRQNMLLNKIKTEGILFIEKANNYFEKIGQRFDFYLANKQLEISEQSLYFSKDKTIAELNVKFTGAKSQDYTKILKAEARTNSTILKRWIEIEKQLQ